MLWYGELDGPKNTACPGRAECARLLYLPVCHPDIGLTPTVILKRWAELGRMARSEPTLLPTCGIPERRPGDVNGSQVPRLHPRKEVFSVDKSPHKLISLFYPGFILLVYIS